MRSIIKYIAIFFCVFKMNAQDKFNFKIFENEGVKWLSIDIINTENNDIVLLNPFLEENVFFCDKILDLKITNNIGTEYFHKVETVVHFEKNQILNTKILRSGEKVTFLGKLRPLLRGVNTKGFDSFTGEYNLESQKKYKIKLTYNIENDGHPSLPEDVFLTKEKEVVIP